MARPPGEPPEADERGVISDVELRRPGVRIPMLLAQALLLAALLLIGVGPLLWLAKGAISTTQDILREPLAFFPSGIVQWGNLAVAWTEGQIGKYLLNTAIIAIGAIAFSVLVCVTAAYVLSVLRPWWGKYLSAALLITLFVPGIVILVPLYLTVAHLPIVDGSLINNYLALWLPWSASAFNILVTKRFFDSLPRELFEAARIDGAGPVRVLVQLVVPMSRPIIGVIALLTAMASWKDYLWPLLVIPSPDLRPISVALPKLAQGAEVSVQLASLFLALIIPVALFLVFQRQILRGVGLSGGIKE